jgi:spermidine/putrescine transport system substrate-binding protein
MTPRTVQRSKEKIVTDERQQPGKLAPPAPAGSGLTRRAMLQRAGGGALALSAAGALLAGCGSSSSSSGSTGSSGTTAAGPEIPIATRENPLTLPLTSGNAAIKSGIQPEKGPLLIYDWAEYLSNDVVKSFEQKYGVSAQVTNFASVDEAVNKISQGVVQADVWVPEASRLLQLAQANLIQPINHDYIPNLNDVIPAAADPWYDSGARYSTPNFINLYGIGWRNDLIQINPQTMTNPYDVYWNAPSGTAIGAINADAYTTICMALLRGGFKNFDRITEEDINGAVTDLQKIQGLKLQYTAFEQLGSGVEPLAFCYNGDILLVPSYLPKGKPATVASFYLPQKGRGMILNDMWVIPKGAKNPVLAHLFMNHFLELDSAIANFRDIGYQTMLKDLTVDKLKAAKVADPYVIDLTFATPADQADGLPVPVLSQAQQIWFEAGFARLQAG